MAVTQITAEEMTSNVNTGTEAAAKKTASRKTTAKKAAGKKAAPARETAKKPAVKKTVAPKAAPEPAETMVLQFGGREIDGKDLFARAKEIWTETGHETTELNDVKLYIKPDELAAYYVLNGDVTGCINL